MTHPRPFLRFLSSLTLASLALAPALAQAAVDMGDDEEEAGPSEDSTASDEASAEEAADGEAPAQGEDGAAKSAEGDAAAAAPAAEVVNPDELQFEVGARGRLIIVPQWLINAFGVAGGRDLIVGGVGAEGGLARGPFEGLLGVWYAGYGMDQTPFRTPGDPDNAWENVKSNAGMLYITADLMGRVPVAPGWHWYGGVGAGLGIVTGSIQRNETYWAGAGRNPYTDLANCTAPGVPAPGDCPGPDNSDNPYQIVNNTQTTPWPVYPWLNLQTGIRYQPIKHFIARIDLGAGSSGFWFGIGADYGI